jgi:hypothetical protein
MAGFIKLIKRFKETFLWKIITILLYAAAIALIFIFYSGHGVFIYENF